MLSEDHYSCTQSHHLAYMPTAQKTFKHIISKNVTQRKPVFCFVIKPVFFKKQKEKGKKKGGGVAHARHLRNHKKKVELKVNTWK